MISQETIERVREQAEALREAAGPDVDIMLEVKDKERSVLRLMQSLPGLQAVGHCAATAIRRPALSGWASNKKHGDTRYVRGTENGDGNSETPRSSRLADNIA